jgi:phage terminase large subunit
LSALVIDTAEVFEPLLQASRYKAAHGGRGSGKSHFFASNLVEEHYRNPGMRSVCIREVQKSLKESAKKLIEDKIAEYGLGPAQGFECLKDETRTPGGGVIIYQGMQDHTAESIKSLEGFDRAWVEEAQTLSATSLKLLRPTIRKKGSELWFSWNPRRKVDPVDRMFRHGNAPTNSIVVQANWRDNPWFPAELEQERQDCLRDDPDQYDHIWEGGYVTVAEGAYYARHLAVAKAEGRIGFVPADPNLIIRLFADIGGTGAKSDNFVFWAAQFVGAEIRWVNHYEAQGQEIGEHLNWMRSQGYTPDRCKIWLPHDGATNDKVLNVSYESAFSNAEYKVEVIPNQGKGAASIRIDEARRLFPRMRFHQAKCQAGLDALGWYHEKKDEDRDIGLGPAHDWASHSADAFGLGCVAYEEPKSNRPMPKRDISWVV